MSYAYEWPFGMLKDAALLHLELMREALAAGSVLKDSSPSDVRWRGSIRSSSTFRPSSRSGLAAWVGYRQFCELLLFR